MIRSVLIAAALLAAAPAFAENPAAPRYQMEVTLLNNGAEVSSFRTTITEGDPASATVSGAGVSYRFDTRLTLARSHPSGDQMNLQADIQRNGVAFGNPALVFSSDGPASIEMGDESGELIRLVVSSVPPATN